MPRAGSYQLNSSANARILLYKSDKRDLAWKYTHSTVKAKGREVDTNVEVTNGNIEMENTIENWEGIFPILNRP